MGRQNNGPGKGSNRTKTSIREKMSEKQWIFGKQWNETKDRLGETLTELQAKGTSSVSNLLPFLQDMDLLKWTESLTEGAATVYDEAMDRRYLETNVGGGNHRLFDGGHTLTGSWERAREALPDDTFGEELVGWARAYMKDLTTVKGMPFFNLDKASYDTIAEKVAGSVPGLDRKYLYDLLSFDAMEICAASLGAVGVLFALKADDKQKLSEVLGAMGISSIVSANPILGITTIAVTAYSYWKHVPLDATSGLKGGSLAAVSAVMFALLGLPILVELVIVMVLSSLIRKHIIDNGRLAEWLKAKILESLGGAKDLLGLDKLLSFSPSRG